MKSHTTLGCRILEGGTTPYMRLGAEIALTHHERYDGTGYPRGLRGDGLPDSARIIAVCDQYDALRSRRPYKQPIDHPTTVGIITRGDGRTRPEHFHPGALQAFRDCADAFEEVYSSNSVPP